jgi:hypothetical protein
LDGKSLLGLIQSGKLDKVNQAFGFWKDGISIRTDSYRLTKFYREEEPRVELYNHLVDPNENRNIAAYRPKLVDSLTLVLEEKLPEFYLKIN